MTLTTGTDLDDAALLAHHREVLAARPELRAVFQEWYRWLLDAVEGLHPVVEIGAGPGFFKMCVPSLIATDFIVGSRIDVQCDAAALPLRRESVGALVLIDALHCFPKPMKFLEEAARVLRPGGRVATIETWITPPSFILWRYLHHVECRFGVDLDAPFGDSPKAALWGNTAIAGQVLQRLRGGGSIDSSPADSRRAIHRAAVPGDDGVSPRSTSTQVRRAHRSRSGDSSATATPSARQPRADRSGARVATLARG